MSHFDDFIHISTGAPPAPSAWPGSGSVSQDYFDNAKGLRTNTEAFLADSVRKNHPKHHLTVIQWADFIGFAQSRDNVILTPSSEYPQPLTERRYSPPTRRFEENNNGEFHSDVLFGAYDLTFQDTTYLLYLVRGQDGMFPAVNNYILTPIEESSVSNAKSPQDKADELLAAVGIWTEELHGEVLVFDQGFWQKNTELYNNIQKANWEDVILEEEKKESIINDILGFFKSGKRYAEYGVPWKRGVIFYGPPGNGKTISTKALMHDVSKRTSPTINNLYVKSFNSWMGPEAGIRSIFQKARQTAPCLLIFEDIDSLVYPDVRSYFLNEVDGLESNHGILMIGSTNHLERLDPGLAKRPSRFDRKYFFDNPNEKERELYAEYWRHKLSSNKKIDFPKALSAKIASITKDFSFAYIKEAFVAALLVIVAKGEEKKKSRGSAGSTGGGGDEFEDNQFWQELKRQVENLRKEMSDEGDERVKNSGNLKETKSNLRLDEGVARGMSPGQGLAFRSPGYRGLPGNGRDPRFMPMTHRP